MTAQKYNPKYWLYELIKNLAPKTQSCIIKHGAHQYNLDRRTTASNQQLTQTEVHDILAYLIHIYTKYYLPEQRKSPHWQDIIDEQKYKQIPRRYHGIYRPLGDGKYCIKKSFYNVCKTNWYHTPNASVLANPGTDKNKLKKLITQLHPYTSVFYEYDFEKIREILVQLIDMTHVLHVPTPQTEYGAFGCITVIPKDPTYHEYITEQATRNSKLRALKELQGIRDSNKHLISLEDERHKHNKKMLANEFENRKSKFFKKARSPFSIKTR